MLRDCMDHDMSRYACNLQLLLFNLVLVCADCPSRSEMIADMMKWNAPPVLMVACLLLGFNTAMDHEQDHARARATCKACLLPPHHFDELRIWIGWRFFRGEVKFPSTLTKLFGSILDVLIATAKVPFMFPRLVAKGRPWTRHTLKPWI